MLYLSVGPNDDCTVIVQTNFESKYEKQLPDGSLKIKLTERIAIHGF